MTGEIGLVSCVKTKRDEPAAPKNLYISSSFEKIKLTPRSTTTAGGFSRPSMASSTQTVSPSNDTTRHSLERE
jgi:hypothetical protein